MAARQARSSSCCWPITPTTACTAFATSNCQLQTLAEELGVRQRRFAGEKSRYYLDMSSPSIVRDPAKCILCGKCVRVCEEIQGVAAIDFIGRGSRAKIGTAFDEGLNVSGCINCGQCIGRLPDGRPDRAEPRQGSAHGTPRPVEDVRRPARSGRLGHPRRGVRPAAGNRRGGQP